MKKSECEQFSDRYEKEDARQSNAQIKHVMAIGRRRTREGQRIIPLSERSMVNEECPSTSKGTMQWKFKPEERKKRLGMFGYKLFC
jgi:hypothetical protein